MREALLAAVLVVGVWSPAGAMTGSELREYCATRWDLCHGFIVGAAWMFRFQMQAINPVCFGNSVSSEQIHDVVVNYLEDNPEVRQEPAIIVVAWAIREAFDCPETPKRSIGNEEKADDRGDGGAVGALPSKP
jgi:hypothetical protein